LITDGECEFDQNVFVFVNIFKTKYEHLFEAYNGTFCAMDLIKNEKIPTKGN